MEARLLSKSGRSISTPSGTDANPWTMLRYESCHALGGRPVSGSPARARWWALLATGLVQLDVPTTQRTRRVVAAGHVELEAVIASGLAIVRYVHLIGEPVLAIHLGGTLDMARGGVHYPVGGYTGAFHPRASRTVIDVGQVAPERALFDPTRDTEVSFRAGGCGRDPAAAGDEIRPGGATGRRRGRLAGDIGVRRGDDHVRHPRHDDMERVDGDVSWPGAGLLVDDYLPNEQRQSLVRRSRDRDGLAVHGQRRDIRVTARRRPVIPADGRSARLEQAGRNRIAGDCQRDLSHRRLGAARVALTHRGRVQHLRRQQAR